MDTGFALFDTAIGRCGIGWRSSGIMAVQLPEADDAATCARLRRRCPEAREGTAPDPVARVCAAIVALTHGQPQSLMEADVDLAGVPPFHQQVYVLTRAIAPGSTSTYGAIARALGMPGAAQAVGRALAENPVPIIVPCHRVLAAGGRIGGFSGAGGIATKRRLLAIEADMATDPRAPSLFGGLPPLASTR